MSTAIFEMYDPDDEQHGQVCVPLSEENVRRLRAARDAIRQYEFFGFIVVVLVDVAFTPKVTSASRSTVAPDSRSYIVNDAQYRESWSTEDLQVQVDCFGVLCTNASNSASDHLGWEDILQLAEEAA